MSLEIHEQLALARAQVNAADREVYHVRLALGKPEDGTPHPTDWEPVREHALKAITRALGELTKAQATLDGSFP